MFEGRRTKQWINIETVAMGKLAMLNRSAVFGDLKIPPQNSVEVLKKDRRDQHSIRISVQWRLCFRWMPASPDHVESLNHH